VAGSNSRAPRGMRVRGSSPDRGAWLHEGWGDSGTWRPLSGMCD